MEQYRSLFPHVQTNLFLFLNMLLCLFVLQTWRGLYRFGETSELGKPLMSDQHNSEDKGQGIFSPNFTWKFNN